jgi:hypothetical protein
VLAAEVYNTSHKNASSLGLGGVNKQSVVVLLLYGTSGGESQGRFDIFIKCSRRVYLGSKSDNLLLGGECAG